MMFFKKENKTIPEMMFDPQKQKAVLRCSICNGEQVAGFRDAADGVFTEVMLIRSEKDLEFFKERYKVTDVTKEY